MSTLNSVHIQNKSNRFDLFIFMFCHKTKTLNGSFNDTLTLVKQSRSVIQLNGFIYLLLFCSQPVFMC